MKMDYVDKSAGENGGQAFDIRVWIEKGLSWDKYLSECKQNEDRMSKMYRKVSVPRDTIDFLKAKDVLTIVCISEDWCPDCAQNVPLMVKLAEALPSTDLRLFFRDRNEKLMDHYLTNGKRVVPTVVFFDSKLNEIGKWAGPSRKAKAWTLDTLVKGRRIGDIPQEERDRFGELYDEKFLSEFLNDSLSEITAALG